MKRLFVAMSLLSPSIALAHPGHLTDVAGHSHWLAAGALMLAGALVLRIAVGRKAENNAKTETLTEVPSDEKTQET